MPPTGTLNERLEQQVIALAERLVADQSKLEQEIGSLRPFAKDAKRSPEVEAMLYLPYWWVYGNAEPEVSIPFWTLIEQGVDPVTGQVDEDGGPLAADAWHHRMFKLWETREPPYALLARQVAPADVMMDFAVFRQLGWHLGEVKPDVRAYLPDGKLPEKPKAEPGSAVDRLRSLLDFRRGHTGGSVPDGASVMPSGAPALEQPPMPPLGGSMMPTGMPGGMPAGMPTGGAPPG